MPGYCSIRSLIRRAVFLSFLFVLVSIGSPSFAASTEAFDALRVADQRTHANYSPIGLDTPAAVSWKKKIGEPNRFRGVPQINPSTPVIFDGSVFAGSSTGFVHAFSLERGEGLWTFESGSPIEAAVVANKDYLCFATLGGTLYCLDRLSGVEVFNYRIMSSINSAPIMDSENIYFISTKNRLHAVSLKSGKKLWTYSQRIRGKAIARFVNSPAQSSDKLFILLSNGVLTALNKKTGKELWRRTLLKGPGPWSSARRTPVYLDGQLYLIDKDGAVVVLDAGSGELRVVFDVGRAKDFIVTIDHVIVSTGEELISINRATGNTDWIESVTDGSIEKIFGAGKHIYTISSKEVDTFWTGFFKRRISYISAFTIDDGTRIWKKKFRSSISASVVAANDNLSIFTDKGRLYVFNSRTR